MIERCASGSGECNQNANANIETVKMMNKNDKVVKHRVMAARAGVCRCFLLHWRRKNEAINQLGHLTSKTNFTCVLIVAILLLNSLVYAKSSQLDRFITDESPESITNHHNRVALQSPGFELAADSQGEVDELGKILAHSNDVWSNFDNLNSLNTNSDHDRNSNINNLIKIQQEPNQLVQLQQQQQQQQQLVEPTTFGDHSTGPANNNSIDNSSWPAVNSSEERNHRASIVQSDYGDHAESSELEDQFSSMIGATLNSGNSSNNQSADLSSDREKWGVAPTAASSATTTTTSDNIVESRTALDSSRRQNYTQNAVNSEHVKPSQQSGTNSTEPNKQQQQQQRQVDRIEGTTAKKRRKLNQKNRLKQAQSSAGRKTLGQEENNNLLGEGHSTMISYVSQQKQFQSAQSVSDGTRLRDSQAQQQQQRQQRIISPLELIQPTGPVSNDLYNHHSPSLSAKSLSRLTADNEASATNALSSVSRQQQNPVPSLMVGASESYWPFTNATAPMSSDSRQAMRDSKQYAFGQQQNQFMGSDRKGPFELEQLQATASSLRSNTEMVHTLDSSSANNQPGEASTSSSQLEPNREATSGDSESDDEQADYDSDEPPSSGGASGIGSPDRAKQEKSDTGRENKPGHEHGVGQTRANEKANQTVSNGQGQTSGQTANNADNKQDQGQQQQQVPDETNLSKIFMRSPGVSVGNDELLVGPFKSEAEAPATITLAGVIYQKSGASSALIRAGSSRYPPRAAATDSSSGNHGVQGQQVVLDGTGQQQLRLNQQQPIQATVATSTDQLAALRDLPLLSQSSSSPSTSSSIQNSLLALQQANPLYFDQTKGTSSSADDSSATSIQFMHQVSPTLSMNGVGGTLPISGGGGGGGGQSLLSDQQQAALLRFSPFLGGLKSSSGASSALLSSLAGGSLGGQFGLLPPTTGEQLSLSSSNAKPTTTTSISGLAAKSQLAKGRLATLVSPSTSNLYSSSTSLLPQLDQQHDRLIMSQLTEAEAGMGLGLGGSSFKRLPGGTTIWTIGGARSPTLEMAPSSLSSTRPQSLAGGAAEQNQASESKTHHHQATGGPIVIVQKDVKPVKYHLLRAYLKLRRLLRPFEATYVFPGDHGAGGSGVGVGIGRSVTGAGSILTRRRHFGFWQRLASN